MKKTKRKKLRGNGTYFEISLQFDSGEKVIKYSRKEWNKFRKEWQEMSRRVEEGQIARPIINFDETKSQNIISRIVKGFKKKGA